MPGYVLIADRNANKLLIVSPSKRIVWQFPRPGDLRPGQSFADPDDAFFAPGDRRIVTNEEFNDQVAQIDLRTHRLVWSYGRAGIAGSAAGELSNPDDAYAWPDGTITVADIKNCRVVRIDRARRITAEVGGAGCRHDPPRALASPNGATPLPDGGMLVTEIGGWVDRLTAKGRLVYAVRTPTSYPSDAQLLPDGNILVAGFNTPGRVDEITPGGRVVWTYGPASGRELSTGLRSPSAGRTGRSRSPTTGTTGSSSSIPGRSGSSGSTATTGSPRLPPAICPSRRARPAPCDDGPARAALSVRRIGSLPAAASRLAAAPVGHGRILAAGGLVAGTSSREILAGPPGRLRAIGALLTPTHDAGLAVAGGVGFLFGGGEAVSTDAVVRIDERTGRARRVGSIGEPLSDLGAVALGGRIYLVGGYTGSRYATAVLRYRRGSAPALVARLPVGLRYAGVATRGGRIYVAGGVTASGVSDSVFAVDPLRHRVRVVASLPGPIAHAPLASLGGALYLVGGSGASGAPVDRILRIDPRSGAVNGRRAPAGAPGRCRRRAGRRPGGRPRRGDAGARPARFWRSPLLAASPRRPSRLHHASRARART